MRPNPARSFSLSLGVPLALLACAAAARRPTVDLRPEMAGARADSAAIAVLVARDRLAAALPAAQRLARIDLARGAALGPDFDGLAARLRAAASDLATALEAGDAALARTRFDGVARACATCHEVHRPGGVAGAEVLPIASESDPGS